MMYTGNFYTENNMYTHVSAILLPGKNFCTEKVNANIKDYTYQIIWPTYKVHTIVYYSSSRSSVRSSSSRGK